MLLDMLAALARKDYEDRRRRQLEGIQRARKEGKYVGRKPDIERRASIASLLEAGQSYSSIQKLLGCSRHLIADVKEKTPIDNALICFILQLSTIPIGGQLIFFSLNV